MSGNSSDDESQILESFNEKLVIEDIQSIVKYPKELERAKSSKPSKLASSSKSETEGDTDDEKSRFRARKERNSRKRCAPTPFCATCGSFNGKKRRTVDSLNSIEGGEATIDYLLEKGAIKEVAARIIRQRMVELEKKLNQTASSPTKALSSLS